MSNAVVNIKGQIVIPSKIRRKLNLKKGTKISIIEKEDQIILQPLTNKYFENIAGILKSGGKLTKSLLEERAKEKEQEEKKW